MNHIFELNTATSLQIAFIGMLMTFWIFCPKMKDTSTNKSNDNLSSIFRTWLSQLWYFPLCRKGNYTIWTYERGIENIDIGMGRTTETQHNLLKHHTYIIFKHVTFNQCPILTKVLIYHNVEPQKIRSAEPYKIL